MSRANSRHIVINRPAGKALEERIFNYKRRYHDLWTRKYNPIRSFSSGIRPHAEALRNHNDLVFYIGDRLYEVMQDFVGHPVDPKAMTVAIQQALLSIDKQQGIRLDTHVFLLFDDRTKSVNVRLGERGDLENLCGDLRHIKVVEVELPYERRKSILELPNGLPPIGGVPWRS